MTSSSRSTNWSRRFGMESTRSGVIFRTEMRICICDTSLRRLNVFTSWHIVALISICASLQAYWIAKTWRLQRLRDGIDMIGIMLGPQRKRRKLMLGGGDLGSSVGWGAPRTCLGCGTWSGMRLFFVRPTDSFVRSSCWECSEWLKGLDVGRVFLLDSCIITWYCHYYARDTLVMAVRIRRSLWSPTLFGLSRL